ncbi:C-C motif chemokine 1 isoform X2 [Mus caroli]|uniref:C-C motif chemokine 1 isoform X2 n=1 Tax=Mus caroli TaxID=10089 RepID=A0A6P5QXP2_MUSCR|nr:C-C motif chemokine 1 isoform X2 [Mus caroli]
MKPTAMTLMCLLLATVWIQDVDSKSMVMPSNSCCLNTLKKELPLKFIQCYRKTGSTCPHPPAVIVRSSGVPGLTEAEKAVTASSE